MEWVSACVCASKLSLFCLKNRGQGGKMVQHNWRSGCMYVCLYVGMCACVCVDVSVRPIRERFLHFDRECKIFGSPIQITRVMIFCRCLAMFNPKYFLLAFCSIYQYVR